MKKYQETVKEVVKEIVGSIVEVPSSEEGLEGLLGKRVLLMCASLFYAGKLTGVNEKFVKLEDMSIVYDTGKATSKTYADAEHMGEGAHYVQREHIESYRLSK